MSTSATTDHGHSNASASHRGAHTVPLWGLFLALLALTAAEVGLFEFWHRTAEHGQPIFPKIAMVLLLLVFTIPKAAIVMVYFMHLKFEKQLIVTFALVPFLASMIAILVTLSDNLTLKNQGKNDNFVPNLAEYNPHANSHAEPGSHDKNGPAGASEPESRDTTHAEPAVVNVSSPAEAPSAASGNHEESAE
ncbi:MAG: cytochrome C oxidase subunit IV family protein [Phycisphaeraceae bacterium]|nr:cytochrome C oxidase subunit IV family protein [Phycisphaeraceae bacterium]